MASELSRLIDDELSKVEQEGGREEKRGRTSFQIKGPAKPSDEPSWRELAWWTWKRLISFAFGALLLFFVLWLVLARPSTDSTTAYPSEQSLTFLDSDSQINAAMQAPVAGILPPSVSPNGTAEQEGIAPEQKEDVGILESPVQAPGLVMSNATAVPVPSPSEGLDGGPELSPAPEALVEELAPAPILSMSPESQEAESPVIESNTTATEAEGGPVKPAWEVGRKLRKQL